MALTTVNIKSPAVAAMADHIELTQALMSGTSAMRKLGSKYLPMFALEEPDHYGRRLDRATLHPAYSRTVKTLTGKPFSKAVNTDEVASDLKPLLDDIDLEGRNLDAFAAEVFEHTMATGLAGILVEFPDASHMDLPTNEAGLRSVATEKEAGLRPYWVMIRAHQLLGWKDQRIKGRKVITQIRFVESVSEEDPEDEFSSGVVEQIRVIESTQWRTYRKSKERTEWELFKTGVNTAGFVPYVPCYGDRMSFMMGKPALLEMAHLAVKHWQSQSDQDNLLHVARVPILCSSGVDPNDKKFKIVLGGSSFIKLPDGADLKYVEHSGAAIGAGQESLTELMNQMKEAGAELLLLEPGQVTATKTMSDNEVGRCALQRMTRDFQDALNLALDFTMQWLGKGADKAGTVTVFQDFGAASLADASAQLLVGWNTSNKLSDQTTFEELQRRGTIRPDLTWEDEQDRMSEQGPPLADMQAQQGMDHNEAKLGMAQEGHVMSVEERKQQMSANMSQQNKGNIIEARQRFVQK